MAVLNLRVTFAWRNRIRTWTSVAWPAFWRCRFEVPLALFAVLGLLICVVPNHQRLFKSLPLFSDSGMLVATIVYATLYMAVLAILVLWATKLADIVPPVYATRLFNAPHFTMILLIFALFLVLTCTLIVVGNTKFQEGSSTFDETWDLAMSNVSIGNLTAIILLICAPFAGFLKLRLVFSLGMAAGSMVIASALLIVSLLLIVLATDIAFRLGIASVPANLDAEKARIYAHVWWKVSASDLVPWQMTAVAFVLGMPAIPVVRSLWLGKRLRIARLGSAIMVWNAGFFALCAIGPILGVLSFLVPGLPIDPQSMPTMIVEFFVLLFGLVDPTTLGFSLLILAGIAVIEFAIWVAVRLAVLPEA
jgi:hypothetical protein